MIRSAQRALLALALSSCALVAVAQPPPAAQFPGGFAPGSAIEGWDSAAGQRCTLGNSPTCHILIAAMNPSCPNAGGTGVAGPGVIGKTYGGVVCPPVSDPNTPAFQGEAPLTIGTAAATAGRSLKAACTAAGTITVTYPDGSTGVWPVQLTTQVLPIAVTEVNTETATCTFANLK